MDAEKGKLKELFIKYEMEEELANQISTILTDHAYSTEDLDLLCEIELDDLVYMGIIRNVDQKIILKTLKKIAAGNSISLVSNEVIDNKWLCTELGKISEQLQMVNKSLLDIQTKTNKERAEFRTIFSDLSVLCLREETPVDLTERHDHERSSMAPFNQGDDYEGNCLGSLESLDKAASKRGNAKINAVNEDTEEKKRKIQ